MSLTKLSFLKINKLFLLITIVSLIYKTNHFSDAFIPSLFQVLFVITLVLTSIYVLLHNKIKDFFSSIPRKILIAIGLLFLSIVVGWGISFFFLKIPLTLLAFLNFGTFVIGILLFLMISFYTKDDEQYSKLCLYALLIPNFYLVRYFLTHGVVGYWGLPFQNDRSLDGLLDPNIFARIALIPSLFFISLSLFSLKNKKLWQKIGWILIASACSMLVFWTVSRGGVLSLVLGALVIWIVFSLKEFSWKKFFGTGIIVFIILCLAYLMVPTFVQEGFKIKVAHTGSLPIAAEGRLVNLNKVSKITQDDLKQSPHTEERIIEAYFFSKYAIAHPLGIGPNTAYDLINNNGVETYIHLGPDNTYLEVWLWGGFLGLFSFLYLLSAVFVALWEKWKKNADMESLTLVGILASFILAIGFEASLSSYWFFIILALSLRKKEPSGVE